MRIKHLLGRARDFKTRSKCCTGCVCGTGRRRKYKRGGSVRGKIVSVGSFLNRNKARIGTAAMAALWAHRQYKSRQNALARFDPLF